jgi:hypothetical protein
MRTLTAYGIGVVIVLAVLNGIAWQAGSPRLHGLNVLLIQASNHLIVPLDLPRRGFQSRQTEPRPPRHWRNICFFS